MGYSNCSKEMYIFKIYSINMLLISVTAKIDRKTKAKYASVSTSTFYHNVSCHWQDTPDDLFPGDDIKFLKNSIFFIETSCRGCIDLREACSIESAARNHVKRPIIVLFTGPVSQKCIQSEVSQSVLKIKNVAFYRIHISQFTEKTPLHPWFQGQYWRNSMRTTCFPVHHTSDVLRFVTLYKFGGIYLDMDVIVVRPFDLLKRDNFAGIQDVDEIGTAVIALSHNSFGKAIIDAAVKVLDQSYEPKNYNFNSRSILTKALQIYCSTKNVSRMNTRTCPGFRIYPKRYFYPISHSSWEDFFKPGKRVYLGEAYAFHVWNKASQTEIIAKGSPYARLAKKFCPSVFKLYNKNYTLSEKPKKKVTTPKPVDNEDYIVD